MGEEEGRERGRGGGGERKGKQGRRGEREVGKRKQEAD